MKYLKILFVAFGVWLWSVTPVKSDQMLMELAMCMAVIDYQVHMHTTMHHMIPEHNPHNTQSWVRSLSMKNTIIQQVIPRLTPEQTQVLAHMYLIMRNRVFMDFAHAVDSQQLQQFVAEIHIMDRMCEPLNMSMEQ